MLAQEDQFVESFWYYKQYSHYVKVMLSIIVFMALFTILMSENAYFIGTLGTLSSVVEAMLGIPQFYLNFKKKNTEGLAPVLIMMWLFGDFYKLTYYISFNSPLQLILCSVFQICTDVSIMA